MAEIGKVVASDAASEVDTELDREEEQVVLLLL
jgi:hypothetical protein